MLALGQTVLDLVLGRTQPNFEIPADGELTLNADRPATMLMVANTGDRPVQIGSHYHFAEANQALEFDRYEGAMGFFAVRLERDFGRHFAAGIGFKGYQSRPGDI